jgi:hypothetical protein
MTREETRRRGRLGDLRKLFRHRYGIVMPDADDAREDLRELLLVASTAYNPERAMLAEIAQWAPWLMNGKELTQEAVQLIDDVNRTPPYLRKPKARLLGNTLRLTDYERTTLGIRTIRPFDVTDEQLVERRKANDNARKWQKSREAGKKPRDAWLANRWSRLRPWEKQKPPISRATWYRRRADQVRQVRETGVSAVKFNTGAEGLVSVESQRRGKSRRSVAVRKRASERKAARG